ncbi:MAG: efflux RND transporter periplasmic adaptor subunit, partial [Treponema sp.]|nr:efflux RND transporter periplasmic adaptor subunit [Treponema sp.]
MKKFVTFLIILLIIVFGFLVVYNFLPQKYKSAVSLQGVPGAQPQGARGAQRGGGENRGGGEGAQRNAPGRDGARNAAAIRVVTVEPGTIEKSVIINGEILARNQVTIYPTVGGRLVESNYSVGDRVARGAVVARVDPSRPGEVYSRNSIISTVSGTVLQAPYSVGDTVTTQSPVYVIGDLSSLLIETYIAERFVAAIKQGLRASLWFESMPGEIFTAEVYEINPVLDPASRTLRIRLRFLNSDPRIKVGMFATISLVTNRKTNIPVIPRLSIISTYGSWIVFIVDENNTARRREVTLGIDNEEFIEVLDGVSVGDKVVSAGQNFLSDGDPVR